jgi:type II secretory pathway pseudopilin PulG
MTGATEAGMTLIETMISSLVFAVVVSMVLVTMGTLDSTTTQAVETSQESEIAQSAASYLDEYLSGAVAPMVAAVAAGNTSTESSAALGPGSPCWGTSQPASGSQAQSVSAPSRVAITVAHDYDFVFCGDKPGTATPQVYKIALTGCTSVTYGNCTLQIVDYGTSCEPGIASPSGSGCSSPGSIVAAIPNVWCDSYCQGTTGAGVNPAGTAVPRACWDVPGNTVNGCSVDTPPLFEYFSTTGQYGMSETQDSASINYEIENADSTTGELASDNGCSQVTGLYVDLAANVNGCDDAEGDLGSIQMIVFNLTILDANGLPVSTATSKIGSEVDDQVLLGNELATSATCGTAVVESPAQPQAFFPLYDTGVPLDDLGDTSDLQSGTSTGVEFNQTPGPLPCDPAQGSMYFPNSSSTQTSYAYSPAFNSGFGNSVTFEAWFSPQTGSSNQTCASDCAIVSDGDGAEPSGYGGIELAIEPSWAGVVIAANGLTSSINSTGLEVGGADFSCTTACGPTSGYWYFVAGVVTATGSGSTASTTLTTYLCGPSVTGSCTSQTNSKTGSGYATIKYSTGCDLVIGASPFSGTTACSLPSSVAQYFYGYVANAAVYETALTANQIKTQYYEMSQ